MSEIKKINIGGTEYDLPEGGGASAHVEGDALVINNSGGTSSGTGSGSGGGISSVFEDVTALPDNPDEQKIYRVNKPEFQLYLYMGGSLSNYSELLESQGGTLNIIHVSSLPENPEPFSNQETLTATMYILGEDLYGYNVTGDNTWLSNSDIFSNMGMGYGGFITSLDTTNLTEDNIYVYPIISHFYYINANNSGQFKFKQDKEELIYQGAITLESNSMYITLDKYFDLLSYDAFKLVISGTKNGNDFSSIVELNNKNVLNASFAQFFGVFFNSRICLSRNIGDEPQNVIQDEAGNWSAGTYHIKIYAK